MANRGGSRGESWGHEETQCLISLWSDERVQRDLESIPKRKSVLYATMANTKYDVQTEKKSKS